MKPLVIICGVLLALYTGPKLHRMAQVRGLLPGARVSTYPLLQKWTRPAGRSLSEYAYCIEWDDPAHTGIGDNQDNIGYAYWSSLNVGDPIRIARVGHSDEPHVIGGIDSDNGNCAFDAVLLLLELGGAIYALISWVITKDPFYTKSYE